MAGMFQRSFLNKQIWQNLDRAIISNFVIAIGFLVSVSPSFGAGLNFTDPLSQLDKVSLSPASTLLDTKSERIGCTEDKKLEYRLLDVVESALCHNPKTQSAWANVKAQAAQVGIAKSAYLPTLSASIQASKDHATNYGTASDPFYTESNSTYRSGALTLNWVLYDFGIRSSSIENTEKLLASAIASQDSVLQTVFATAVKDYYSALVALKNVQATRDIETAAKRVLDAAVFRVRGGVAAISDQYQAQTAYSQAVYNRNRAEGDLLSSLGALAMDIGQRPNSSIQLVESKDTALTDTSFVRSIDELLKTAQELHPALRAAKAELEAAQANKRNIQAQGRPSISLVSHESYSTQPQSSGVGQQYVGVTTRDRYVGVQVDIPLFEGFARSYKTLNAEAQIEEKAAALSDAELQIASGVWSNYQTFKITTANLNTTQEILTSAQLAFEAAENRYAKGVANILELINTQTSLANAQQQRIQALSGWQNARLQLASSMGTLGLWAIKTAP